MALDRDDEQRLTAFALGELDDDERAAVDDLLARSPEARLLVDEVRAAEIVLRTSLRDEPFSPDGRDLSLSPAQRQAIEACLTPPQSRPLTLATASRRAGFPRSRLARLALAASLLVGVGTAILTYQVIPMAHIGGMAPNDNLQVGRAVLPKMAEAPRSNAAPMLTEGEADPLRAALARDRKFANEPAGLGTLRARNGNELTRGIAPPSLGMEATAPARKPSAGRAEADAFDKTAPLSDGMMGAALPPPASAAPAPDLAAVPASPTSTPAPSERFMMRGLPVEPESATRGMRSDPTTLASAPAPAAMIVPASAEARAEEALQRMSKTQGSGLVFRNIETDAKPGQRSGGIAFGMDLQKKQGLGKDLAPIDRFLSTREQLAQSITPASRAPGPVGALRQKLVVENRLPERGRVEVAALINDLALPAIATEAKLEKQKALEEQPVALAAEIASSPWAPSNRLARIALQARPGAPGQVVARNARLQVEFEPRVVSAFRPVGSDVFEKDAARPDQPPSSTFSLSAGQSLTALYEMVPVAPSPDPPLPSLLVRLAYETEGIDVPRSIQLGVRDDGHSLDRASDAFRLAAAVAAFGRRLDDPAIQVPSFNFILDLARGGFDKSKPLPPGQRTVIELIERARDIERDEPPAVPGPVP